MPNFRRRRRLTHATNQRSVSKKKTIKYIALILGLVILFKIILLGISYGPLLFQLVFNQGINLSNTNGHVNVALLGIGGGTHEGPDLTDTIILASLDENNKQISLISIPRDLWVPDLNGKINTAYAIGEQNKSGDGLIMAKAAIQEVTGQEVNYAMRIDFSGFVKAVDLVGGLDINVTRSFDDYEYPIAGMETATCGRTAQQIQQMASTSSTLQIFPCRYIHVHFNAGEQHMDGERALEYVRSRHAIGVEGTDFARSKRQEKVITAFRAKVFSVQTLANPGKVLSLYNILKSSIDTDIPQDQFDDFFRLAEKLKGAKIQSYSIDTGSTNSPGLLVNPPPSADTDYAWLLAPRIGNGNFSEIHSYVSCVVTKGKCKVSQTPQ